MPLSLPQTVVQSAVSQAPLLAKLISVIAIASYLIAGLLIPSLGGLIGMVPVDTVGSHFQIWTILTAPYFEQHLIHMLLHVAIIMVSSRYLCMIWSNRMFVLFVIAVNVGTYLCTLVFSLLLYQITFHEPFISSMYCGLGGLVAGLTVVAKQQIPEYSFSQWWGHNGPFEMRGKWLPFVLFVWTAVWAVIAGSMTELPIVVFGIVVSWFYLRYYQRKDDGSVGDRGASLAFKTLFPSHFHPMVDRIESLFTRMLERIGLIRSQSSSSSSSDAAAAANGSGSGDGAVLPIVNTDAISEEERKRRREMAGRVLEEYMNKGSPNTVNGSTSATHSAAVVQSENEMDESRS